MFGLDDQQLHEVAADHLDHRVLPLLGDEKARIETEALIRVLRRNSFGPQVDDVAGVASPEATATDWLDTTRDALSGCVARITDALTPAAPESLGITEEAMTSHLRARLGEPTLTVTNLVQTTSGFSKQTVLFDKVDGTGQVEGLALRRDLRDSPVETSVRDEFPVVCDLHAAGIAVAEPLWLDEGSEHVPGPFLISRRVQGAPIGDPAGGASSELDFDPTELLATTLAQLHGVPLSAMTRSRFCDATWDLEALRAQLDYAEARYRDHAPVAVAVLDAALGWLRRNASLGLQDPVLVHGDYGFYNMLVKDGRLVALVDWELAHVGSPAWDLAYVRDHLRQLGIYERFIAGYEAAGATVPPSEAIDYFHILSLVRTITMCLVTFSAFDRGDLTGVRLVDTCQVIYPNHLSSLATELARVAHDIPATTGPAGR